MAGTVMTRTPPEALAPEWREAWETLNGLTGEPAFVEVMAAAPELLGFIMQRFYGEIFFAGRVDARLKQLVRLRLSLAHGCRSCNLQNRAGTLAAGFTPAQLEAIEGDRSGFTECERAVLDFADRMVMTNLEGRLDTDLYQRLRVHLSDAEICELAVVAGFIGGMAKMAFVLDVVEKEESCPFVSRARAA
ncbi:MAG: carboxymuconolactone decarboxylase family protein [Thermaurantiacus sp.]